MLSFFVYLIEQVCVYCIPVYAPYIFYGMAVIIKNATANLHLQWGLVLYVSSSTLRCSNMQ